MSVIIQDNSEDVLAALREQTAAALEAIGQQAEGDVKPLVPVDTGRLRNSISHTADETSAYIGTNVEYAAYVEMGTSKMAAQPYLRPGIENNVDTYKRIAEQMLRG